MWYFTEQSEQRLRKLCSTLSPSSYELGIQKILAQRFRDMGIDCKGDSIGNLYASLREKSDFRVGIVAHCDEIGVQITEIDKQGFLRFRKIGGLRPTSLIGQRVCILTEHGPVRGIVGCDPLQKNETENGFLVKTSDLWIDIGAESYQVCAAIVGLGDYGCFEPDFVKLSHYRYAAKSFDDRLGVLILEETMDILRKEELEIGVTAITTVQEEIRLRGAEACSSPMDVAIVLDVDYSTDIPADHSQMGNLTLGQGIGICRNADSNVVIQKIFCNMAKDCAIPVQTTLNRHITGGTDAAQIEVKGNVATLNVNIPLRYMHSHYEMCDIRDIEYAVRAVVGLVRFLNNNKLLLNFCPWQNL